MNYMCYVHKIIHKYIYILYCIKYTSTIFHPLPSKTCYGGYLRPQPFTKPSPWRYLLFVSTHRSSRVQRFNGKVSTYLRQSTRKTNMAFNVFFVTFACLTTLSISGFINAREYTVFFSLRIHNLYISQI